MSITKPWKTTSAAEPVGEILAALDAPAVDEATRHRLERLFHLREHFHKDARGHITLLIRTIMESAGNEGALVEPVVSAVSSAMRPAWTSKGVAWLEAFDTIPLLSIVETMRSLELFSEKSLGEYLGQSIRNRLWKIFGPDVPAKPVKIKAKVVPKPPAKITRIPVVEKRIALGLKLLLKARSRRNNDYSQLRKRHFGDVEPVLAMEAARVARIYGQRPEIYRRASWQALIELSSPSLSTAARRRFEARIMAGEDIKGVVVKRARGRLPTGRPGRRETRLAA